MKRALLRLFYDKMGMSAVNWALSYRDWKAYYIKNGHSDDQDAAFVVSKIELAKGRSVRCLATSNSGVKVVISAIPKPACSTSHLQCHQPPT